ncbi:DUF5672 family protein [Mucilaginibacter sp. KACC 22063]|uniref:DUF5672 family protein n=1 Tax=Mucilaginibacter sp. KACC 22063 TaxID=3025666 RepID=UPI0023664082|nr:DUF5672 family protein [Mucilaginibacter sp. KACC 22063]WDF54279.1 DUF5672 family protein [Mucilaginibacter sp. KACC 22063]
MPVNVAVVIPVYQNTISDWESIALQQCNKILANYPKIVVKPQSLILSNEFSRSEYTAVYDFDDAYFSGIAGYNKLMLSADFYSHFSDYEFILIYQMDAFVFKDELNYWCDQEFDYIGAPWIRKKQDKNPIKRITVEAQQKISTALNLKKNGVPNKYQFENKVGNGGFSLRRVSKFLEVATSMRTEIESYLEKIAHQYNEDAFWSIEANRKRNNLNIPDWQTGLRFAFETYPERALQLNNNELPFGCHDWDNYPDFWRPVFNKFGYNF